MVQLRSAVARVAASNAPVVVIGETGSGKERVARAIHDASPRARGPFVAVNGAALVSSLLESELFGHAPGAFTGAVGEARGAFRRAEGGTLFLDEVGELSLPAQAKLLRALDSGEIQPVGGRSERVDVRIVAATHRNLPALVLDRRFREDLFYRLAVLTVRVPPLRERGADFPTLCAEILAQFAPDTEITHGALASLRARPWVGNVRELRNVLVRAALLGEGRIDARILAADAGY